MASHQMSAFILSLTICLLSVLSKAPTCKAATKYYDFEVSIVNYTRNCYTKPLVAVNGLYPGPTIYISEGDRVIVKVNNAANVNVTIHWHGIRQVRQCWQDGAGYITECPIQPGNYEIYDFVVSDHRGTTFWHAHVTWLRATVYGAFITLPANGYPFPKPHKEIPILLGEWWNEDVELVEQQFLAAGTATFVVANALTMNGFPGTQYNCSESEGLTVIDVEPGKTYLLRVINAGLNTDLFFAIANHTLTVVEVDSGYSKPFTVDKGIDIGPGQTLNVLVTADQSPGTYYMVGKSHHTLQLTSLPGVPPAQIASILADFPPVPTTGLFQYKHAPVLASDCIFYPDLPATDDSDYSTYFATSLRTLYPDSVPSSDNVRHLFYTVGFGTEACTTCDPQQGGYRRVGSVNNISFVNPTTAILPAYFYKIPGVYSPTFPDFPPVTFDYTNAGAPPNPDYVAENGTRVAEVEYGTVIDLVLQDLFAFEDHPFHLHGHSFYVLGQGFGNYNATSDPGNFNYYDPIARSTVNVPPRGWVAIRFKADNPGVWLFHCHFEHHFSIGMSMVFIVKNGKKPDQTLPGPPRPINPC